VWINFSEERVFRFLVNYGEVYTVRHYPARSPLIRRVRRGREIKFDVILENVLKIRSYNDLKPYVSKSGFETLEQWKEAIRRLHGKRKDLWLLRVYIPFWSYLVEEEGERWKRRLTSVRNQGMESSSLTKDQKLWS